MTRKAFVIGHPIQHSRSPLIHGAWLREHDIDGSYEAVDVSPMMLEDFFTRLRRGEFVGGNVTIPHKEAVFALCDTVDPLARTIGAVNTLVVDRGNVHGTNTDYLGFLGNLDAAAPGWSDDLEEAIVLGAGGAARAILVALRSRKVGHIHVLNRTRATAEALAEEIEGLSRPAGSRILQLWRPKPGSSSTRRRSACMARASKGSIWHCCRKRLSSPISSTCRW